MTAFDRLKKLCDEQGISINVLEERIGLGKNTLYSWKKKVPGGINLEKVADYFGVSTDYLLGRTDNPSTTSQNKKPQLTVEEAMASVMSRDGKPLSEHDQEILIGIIEAYIEKSKGE